MTFDLATQLLYTTYRLLMMIICATLPVFSYPTMHNIPLCTTKLWVGQEQVSLVYAQSLIADCDLNLQPSNMVIVRNTSSCHDNHLCQIIFKSHHVLLSYGPDTILENTNTHRQGKLYMPFRHFLAGKVGKKAGNTHISQDGGKYW